MLVSIFIIMCTNNECIYMILPLWDVGSIHLGKDEIEEKTLYKINVL